MRTWAAAMLAFSPAAPSVEELQSLRRKLTPESNYLASQWAEPWRQHLLGEGNWQEPFEYLTYRDANGKLQAVLPLAVQKVGPLTVQSLAGYYIPSRGFPVALGVIEAFSREVAEVMTRRCNGTLFRFAPVPSWDPACQGIMDALTQRGWRLHLKHNSFRQVIHLPDTFDTFERERKGSRWSAILRRNRKMRREQNVTLKFFTTETCKDWSQAIQDMGIVEQQSWLAREGGDTHFVSPSHQSYWRSVLNDDGNSPLARAWVLFWDEQPVAYNFNIDAGPCRYYLAGHYAEHAGAYSPGNVLMHAMIKDAIERNLDHVDMGGGDPGYKAFWGSRPEAPVVECMAFPPTWRGRALATAYTALESAKQIRTKLRTHLSRKAPGS